MNRLSKQQRRYAGGVGVLRLLTLVSMYRGWRTPLDGGILDAGVSSVEGPLPAGDDVNAARLSI